MRSAVIAAVVATLSVAGALGRELPDDLAGEPGCVAGEVAARPDRYGQTRAVGRVWVTADDQILVELAPDEANRPNLFDLNGRTLVFTPDGAGRYWRRVGALEWEEETGEEVEDADGTVIRLGSFDFPFAGRRWDSVHLGPPGVLTFGAPYADTVRYPSRGVKRNADELISGPTVTALHKPYYRYGTTHVARGTDRMVVTWLSWDRSAWVHGVKPEKPARFQAVLGADGSIRFNYMEVPFQDGIAGLFQEEGPVTGVDLSQSDTRASSFHHEVFHFRSGIDFMIDEVECHLMRTLGDEFDLFVYHSQSRVDILGPVTGWSGGDTAKTDGCTRGRFKGSWYLPVWIKSSSVFHASRFREEEFDDKGFDRGLGLFAHEFGHHWLAYYYYEKAGRRIPLFLPRSEGGCNCHWRREFHTPAAFPWRGTAGEVGRDSTMGGSYWVDRGNGRFSPRATGDGGFSWLDLYAMGLADAEEVPDTFILKNLQEDYTAEKEIVSVDQIVVDREKFPWAPEPQGTAHSQKVFNAGFVYLLEPGQVPSGDMLALHAGSKARVPAHWSHITGGRSRITTVVPRIDGNRPPTAEGAVPALTLTENGTAWQGSVAGYFSDPDGDPLTYRAASTEDGVAEVAISAGTVTIRPRTAGTAVVTVTAQDGRGGLA
ncbi:MAG: Ig-like domain-containing protein, partial [Acidobacteriota bacterium]|nr:Ig-like domain-containing protein [Acidobacteriota bacterium]